MSELGVYMVVGKGLKHVFLAFPPCSTSWAGFMSSNATFGTHSDQCRAHSDVVGVSGVVSVAAVRIRAFEILRLAVFFSKVYWLTALGASVFWHHDSAVHGFAVQELQIARMDVRPMWSFLR